MALVKYNGKNVFGVILKAGEVIRLLPGINEVEDSKLSEMKAHPLFQSRMALDLVQIMHENKGDDGKTSLADMLNNIPRILDLKLLRKIIETDGRDKVVRAAQEQIDKIKSPGKAKAADDEHFH